MITSRRTSRARFASSICGLSTLLIVSLPCHAGSAASYSFQGIGRLTEPGYSYSEAMGISGDGTWVTGYVQDSSGLRLIRWSEANGLEDLGPGAGRAVSNDGEVLVGGALGGDMWGGGIRWTETTGSVDLGELGPYGFTEAFGVSADGSVAVGNSADWRAFKWTEATGMVALPGFDGSPYGEAHAVSADGSVIVGHAWDFALRWVGDAEPENLGFVPGSTFSDAWGVSADGSKVVGRSGDQGFLWSQETGMIGLGRLAEDQVWGYGLDVSADGAVVVGYVDTAYEGIATIWDPDHGLRSLQDVLETELDLAGWQLLTAQAVSDDGRTIAGTGLDPDGFVQGWIAVIPEPSTALMVGLGFAFLSSRRPPGRGRG